MKWLLQNAKDRLLRGDARTILPRTLKELGSLDIFVHDSLHSYEHMKFEFGEAYPHIRPGGLLMSDDVDFNSTFSDFVRAHRFRSQKIISGVGVIKKPTV